MVFGMHAYSLLLVSSSEKMTASLMQMLPVSSYQPIMTVTSVSAAKQAMMENSFDLVVINAPLHDENGINFAIDTAGRPNTVVMLMVKADAHAEVQARVMDFGVFTLPKPTSSALFTTGMEWMKTVREKMRKSQQKSSTLEEKMEEIRVVNRAKWILIERKSMTEAEAHRYIEKEAMNQCVTRRKIAENIIKNSP